jgi:signal transduction histidine kinase/phage shock protein PspC (stress-responsive transcriptional regulator)
MEAVMASSSATATGGSPPLRRDPGQRILGGVCAGLGERFGVDPLVVRLAFLAAALAGGLGIALYVLAWVAIPAGEGDATAAERPGPRGSVEIALGVTLLALSLLLVFRALGIWFSDAVVWPLVLVAAGGALLWRQSTRQARTAQQETKPEPVAERAATVSRTGLGVALVIAAGVAFLEATGSLTVARDVVLAVLVVVIVLGVIFAPWVLRLARSLSAERAERIRSQERAEMAAHLHDSVLQTLALVQRADDPKQVTALARRQERELRAWLSGRSERKEGLLATALEDAAAEVEERHAVQVDVVAVGDRELDPASEALVAAAKEAMVNAAKFGGGAPVAVYAEAADGAVHVFVRDRGPGFDPSAVPPDRRGIRESIVGRMERHGGRAIITSSREGTEVELTLQ